MNKFLGFLRVTIAGGVLFLIPLIVIIVLLKKAIGFLRSAVEPLAVYIPLKHVAGLGVVTLLSIILLLIICFLAGLLMRTRVAKKIKSTLEDNVLSYIPGYSYVKAIFSGTLDSASQDNWKPATIFVDDNEVLCFVIDESEHYCSIFLPAAPSPSSGSVCVREKSLVRYLPLQVSQANMIIRRFGKGAASVLEKIRPGI